MSALYEKIRKAIKDRSQYNSLSGVLEVLSNIQAEKLTTPEMQKFKALVMEVMGGVVHAVTTVSPMQEATMPLHDREQHTVTGQFNHFVQNNVVINCLKFQYPDFIHEKNLDIIELVEIADTMAGTTEYSIMKMVYKDGREEFATGTRIPSQTGTVTGSPIHFSTFNSDIKHIPYFRKTMDVEHRITRLESSVQQHVENLLKNLQVIQRLSEKFQGI